MYKNDKNDSNDQKIGVVKPPLKWAGSKTKLVPKIMGLIPKDTRRVIEPFAGSAVLSLNAGKRKITLADINKDLLTLYSVIKRSPKALLRELETLFIQKNNCKEVYLEKRDEFNTGRLSATKRAAIFVYLNRHGFNGLCRYNLSGAFNVPFGRIATPHLPVNSIIHAHKVLKDATLMCADFRKLLKLAGPNDFVYCDPPYVPLSNSSNFTQYASNSFGLEDQIELVQHAKLAASRGAVVAISNHDILQTRTLYEEANEIISFEVRRTISCDGNNRRSVKELIALYKNSN